MDFEVTYSEAQQRFRQQVRAWLEANVPPGITRIGTSPEDSLQRYRELRARGRALGDKGWLYPRAPAQYGGGGLDLDHSIILEEEGRPCGARPAALLRQRRGMPPTRPTPGRAA